MEASALQAPPAIGRIRVSGSLLRLRSDEQLVALFRAGSEEAFRTIHDRYRQRLFAYVRQMLSGSRHDAEDAMQDVFIRAYAALRADRRPITLRAWLYRVAHNRCIDQLRRPIPSHLDIFDVSRAPLRDPLAETEQRDDLRRLVADVRRLPEQQRSALLMRELQGLTYIELADALGTSIPAVKSLLVRARMGLLEAAESREAACPEIRRDLVLAYDRGVRMSGRVRRHVRDCDGCRDFRHGLRGVRRSFGALVPAGAGPCGLLANLGLGGSGAAAGSGAASGGGAAVLGGGTMAVTATKLALVCCAAVVTGGALGLPKAARHVSASAAGHRSVEPSGSSAARQGLTPAGPVAPAGAAAVSGTTRSQLPGAGVRRIAPNASRFSRHPAPASTPIALGHGTSDSGGTATPGSGLTSDGSTPATFLDSGTGVPASPSGAGSLASHTDGSGSSATGPGTAGSASSTSPSAHSDTTQTNSSSAATSAASGSAGSSTSSSASGAASG